MLPFSCTERDSPRDQLVVTLFLLTVFGLLLGAGIKGRMLKAGFDTSLPWATGRRWWEVSVVSGAFTPFVWARLTCFCLQAWSPQRQPEDIRMGDTGPSFTSRDNRGAYVGVSDSPPNA